MSAFDVKQLSEQDAFRLDKAKKEESDALQSDAANGGTPAVDPENSPVAKVVEQIMSHWADTDEDFAREVAEQSGDPNLKRAVGEAQVNDPQSLGMTGDFQADGAGPTEGIEVPPRADGGEFGGGGGGGSGGDAAGDLGLPVLGNDDGGMGDPGDMPDYGGDLPGFSVEAEAEPAHGGGGGGGSGSGDPNPLSPPKPPDPKKPKKP